jgi:uncharacterized protein (TIGR01615 family)
VKLMWSLSNCDSPCSAYYVAVQLRALGHVAVVRSATGHGPSFFKSLKHEFVVVLLAGDWAEIIVEMHFKEAFLVSHPTRDYNLLMNLVPDIFVGPVCQLVPLVNMICHEMVSAFEFQKRSLPAWRAFASMLTKWVPAKFLDYSSDRSAVVPCSPKAKHTHGHSNRLQTDFTPAPAPASYRRASCDAQIVRPDSADRKSPKSLLTILLAAGHIGGACNQIPTPATIPANPRASGNGPTHAMDLPIYTVRFTH